MGCLDEKRNVFKRNTKKVQLLLEKFLHLSPPLSLLSLHGKDPGEEAEQRGRQTPGAALRCHPPEGLAK